MVANCVAYGCKNLQDRRIPISFHVFPFKRPEILKLWIEAVHRENWYPSKTSRLCGEHFLESDYQVRPGSIIKLLKPDAVPSIFCFTKHAIATEEPEAQSLPSRKSVKAATLDSATDTIKVEPESSIIDNVTYQFNLPSRAQTKIFVEEGTQTFSCNELILLRKKLKYLKQKLRRRNLKIRSMKETIIQMRKKDHIRSYRNRYQIVPEEIILKVEGDII